MQNKYLRKKSVILRGKASLKKYCNFNTSRKIQCKKQKILIIETQKRLIKPISNIFKS